MERAGRGRNKRGVGGCKKGMDSKKRRGEWYDRRRRGVKWSEERGEKEMKLLGGEK